MIVATFFTRLAPNDQYLPVLYIDQLGVIYRYLKVRYIIRDIHVLFTVMHLKHKEALFFFWGGEGRKNGCLGRRGGVTYRYVHLYMRRCRSIGKPWHKVVKIDNQLLIMCC